MRQNNRRDSNREESSASLYNVPVVRNVFFRRSRGCPLADVRIDYRNVDLLSKYISERGRITPSRISSVSSKKQRELSRAIKRARFLALLPYVAQ